MGSMDESTRRLARVLAACMSEGEAIGFANKFTLDPPAFMQAWSTHRTARPSMVRGYVLPRIEDIAAGTDVDAHVAQIRNNPLFPLTYRQSPEFKLVELGKLIAMSHWVDTDISEAVHGSGVDVASEAQRILGTCLPLEIISPVRTVWQQMSKGVLVHTLDNTFDVQGMFVDCVNGQVRFLVSPGANLMLVREYEGRYILANGYHRAWLLRSRGVTMVPVVIQKPPTRQEAVPPGMIAPDIILGPHPPLVDDFLSDEMSLSVTVRSMVRTLKITAEVSVVPRLI